MFERHEILFRKKNLFIKDYEIAYGIYRSQPAYSQISSNYDSLVRYPTVWTPVPIQLSTKLT